MISKLFAIARNTFTEAIRQPVYAVIITAAIILFILSPSLAMYTMSDDDKLLRELGLSTLFLAGLFISIFSAAGAVTEEIETKTITTVLTKPISRATFIVGKFFGISAAVSLAHYLLAITYLMTIRHGVLESASDTHDWVVISVMTVILAVTIFLTAFLNYFYDWNFSSTAVAIGSTLATAGIIILAFVDKNWTVNPLNNAISAFDIYACMLLLFAVLVLVSLAVVLSTVFNIVVTLTGCIGIFLLGLISAYVFGRYEHIYWWAKVGYYIVPDLQPFWISDAIYEGSTIQFQYIKIVATYATAYICGILAIAVALFQRRQVGI